MIALDKVLILARKHVHNDVPMRSSAELALTDAINLRDAGDYPFARERAVKSLAYSVGTSHEDYRRSAKQ